MARRFVVALGGHAITRPGANNDIPSQFAQTAESVKPIVDLLEAGYDVVVTHGNGPQVGYELRRMELSCSEVYPLPLEVCVADTQGGMGYMIAQCMNNELRRRNLNRVVTAVVTSVLVDEQDPQFKTPTKPIGGTYDAAAAQRHCEEDGWDMREMADGRFRRVVPSPKPTHIVQEEAIRLLVDQGHLIIACGGGGVPVVMDSQGRLEGVDAVVDKDLASAVLATEISADCLVILTAVESVYLNFGKTNQKALEKLTLSQATALLQAGQFPPGSMGPKIQASINFLTECSSPSREVLITSPNHIISALNHEAGTRIIID